MPTTFKLNLLAVDDDEMILDGLGGVISSPWNLIPQRDFRLPADTIHVAFVDLHLSQNLSKQEGLEIIRTISEQNPHAEIVAISGDMSRDLMEKALKAGATRFLPKPLNPAELCFTLKKLEAYFELRLNLRPHSYKWVGSSQASDDLRRKIALLQGERSPILIEGESGSGKEVVSHLLHQQEPARPCVALNIASIPDNLFESEFFGYTRGAFTGAQQNKMGLAESANGGDLFLDEIEALPLAQQAKLLRFIENGEIRRVGSNEVIRTEVRIIAATNENLNKMVSEGKFREDLLWRLSAHKISVPALRQRVEDIPQLCEFFISQSRSAAHKKFSDEAIQLMKDYSWPGNVRELKRICEQIALQSPLPIIRAEDVARIIAPAGMAMPELKIELHRGLPELVNDFERKVLETALGQQKDIDALAKLLKISRSSLYKKLKDYGLSL